MVVKCDKCSYTAPYNSLVKSHQFSFHGELKPFQCTFPGCQHRSNVKRNIETHQRTHEVDMELRRPYVCESPSCSYRAANNSNLKNHVMAKHPSTARTRDFQCPLCPSRFFTSECLKKHVPRHMKEKRLKCISCGFATHDSACLQRHVNALHKKSIMFSCSVPGCNFSTPHRTSIALHRKRHDPDPLVRRPFACDFPGCAFRALTSANLNQHAQARHKTQLETEQIFCPLCQKRLRQKRSLMIHIKTVHAIETSFLCSKCSFVTQSSQTYQLHCTEVHGQMEKMLPCETCDYSALTKPQLSLHYRAAHSEEKRFKCDFPECGFSTHDVRALKQHLLIHKEGPEEQLPFACSFPNCDFRRRVKAQMNSHERLHLSSPDPFKCKLCPNRSYPDSVSLHFHQSLHHDSKAYNCPLCGACVFQKQTLLAHLRKCHNQGHGQSTKARKSNSYGFSAFRPGVQDDPNTCRKGSMNTVFRSAKPIVLLERLRVAAM